jgi:malto-oligosyltrehalose trehalohydrolase
MYSFAHAMPFGATLERDGRVSFRLWAPAETTVSLYLPDTDERFALNREADGWHGLVTDKARPGSRYCYELADGLRVPDPASRAQENDPDGPSLVIDPGAYRWRQTGWRGRPWPEAVIYELHVGTFTPEGLFSAIRPKLPALAALGITALELMPVADFPGSRNWGYDGALPFAPDARYGSPDDLKALIDDAHELGLMMMLDVVYNHFGPEGNYLGRYAPHFFTERYKTPWGAAIDFSHGPVRDYFIHNALYWLEEFRVDGLRFDAVHAIFDDSEPDFLRVLARTARERITDREIHLVLENDNNQASLLARDDTNRPRYYTAQWNDDFHHATHTLLTGERAGYYSDYAEAPLRMLARTLAEGFAYQGEPSRFRDSARRGEPTAGLPPDAFVGFLQNHDQIGNRAFGERLTALAKPEALRALKAIQLLAPAIPMLFMGEDWDTDQPFQFFCDFSDHLADSIRKGRAAEFSRFPEFAGTALPDPLAAETFHRSVLQHPATPNAAQDFVKSLLDLRRRRILPLTRSRFLDAQADDGDLLRVTWRYAAGTVRLCANLSDRPIPLPAPLGEIIFATHDAPAAWSVIWALQ